MKKLGSIHQHRLFLRKTVEKASSSFKSILAYLDAQKRVAGVLVKRFATKIFKDTQTGDQAVLFFVETVVGILAA